MVRFTGRIFDPMEQLYQKIRLMIQKHEEEKDKRRMSSASVLIEEE
jgi:hypothetical protein